MFFVFLWFCQRSCWSLARARSIFTETLGRSIRIVRFDVLVASFCWRHCAVLGHVGAQNAFVFLVDLRFVCFLLLQKHLAARESGFYIFLVGPFFAAATKRPCNMFRLKPFMFRLFLKRF